MEQTSNNTEHNMTDRIIEEEAKQEEVVNDAENTTNNEINVEEVKQEEVVNDIENTTNNEINVEEAKQTKTRTKAKPKSKPKTQNNTYTKLTKAEMKELADNINKFYTLLHRIGKIPNLKDILANELLK